MLMSELTTQVKADLARDIRNMPDARDALAKILDAEAATSAHPMTNVLDMLAGIAEERSQMEGDRWEQIGQLVQRCASACEHKTRELV